MFNVGTYIHARLNYRYYERPLSAYSHRDVAALRRPSQFIGFDKIQRPSPPIFRQFKNFPILLAQVDSVNRNKIFGQYPKRHAASVGTVYPETRHVSTVVQFRTVDYGMEICELHVNVDASGSSLDLYRLEGTIPLDASALSFNARPHRGLMLSEIATSHESETLWRRNFTCHSEQLLTFELGCSPGSATGCLFKWWQTPEGNESPGKYNYLAT
ncbi:hypothetical protein B0H19DRAFT_947805 [Mycena capillaripes]|nr:hypothetical protein B0H19DRAFT_947805 [Mycena capillaripes]